jgi:hypothetical protein
MACCFSANVITITQVYKPQIQKFFLFQEIIYVYREVSGKSPQIWSAHRCHQQEKIHILMSLCAVSTGLFSARISKLKIKIGRSTILACVCDV